MRLDFFVTLKKWSSTIYIYILSVLNILCVTYFLTTLSSIIMPELQSNDIICVTYMANDVCAPFCISSTRQSVNSIPKTSIRWKFVWQCLWFPYFLFLVFNQDFLSYTLILPMSQPQTQQVLTAQIGLHVKYLIQTYTILVLIWYSKLMRNIALLADFYTI